MIVKVEWTLFRSSHPPVRHHHSLLFNLSCMSLWLCVLVIIRINHKVKVNQKSLPFASTFVVHPQPAICMLGSPRAVECSRGYEQSLIPFFYVSISSTVDSFPHFSSWTELWWIYHFPEVVPTKNEPEKSLKKSIWPPWSMKWLGILADDVFQHPGQSSSSFQSTDVRIILYWLSQ